MANPHLRTLQSGGYLLRRGGSRTENTVELRSGFAVASASLPTSSSSSVDFPPNLLLHRASNLVLRFFSPSPASLPPAAPKNVNRRRTTHPLPPPPLFLPPSRSNLKMALTTAMIVSSFLGYVAVGCSVAAFIPLVGTSPLSSLLLSARSLSPPPSSISTVCRSPS